MKKLWPWLVLVLCILFIGTGTVFAIRDINKEPPSLKVVSEEFIIPAVQVSYCWTNFGQTVCIDYEDAQVLMDYHQIQPIVVAQAANLELLFDETPSFSFANNFANKCVDISPKPQKTKRTD